MLALEVLCLGTSLPSLGCPPSRECVSFPSIHCVPGVGEQQRTKEGPCAPGPISAIANHSLKQENYDFEGT